MDLDYLQPLEVPLYDESIEEHLDTLMAYTDDDLLDIIDETVRTEEEELASLSEDLLMVLIKRQFEKEYDSFMEMMYTFKDMVMDRLRPKLIVVYKWTMGQLVKYGQVFSRPRNKGGELPSHLKGRTITNPLIVREDMRKKIKVSSSLQVLNTVYDVMNEYNLLDSEYSRTRKSKETESRRRIEAVHTVETLVWQQIDQECLYIAYEHNRIAEWRVAREKILGEKIDSLTSIDNRIERWSGEI